MANRQINHVSIEGGKDVKARLDKPCRVGSREQEALDDLRIMMTNIFN